MTTTQSTSAPSLSYQLRRLQENIAQQLPKEVRRVMKDEADELARSGLVEQSLHVGHKAPKFELPDISGSTVRLSTLLDRGPVVLSFYRGGWCPYCNLQLRALQQALPEIKQCGATLVAISPEMPDHALSTSEKHLLEFEVLSDYGNKVASQFGVVFTLPDVLRRIYDSLGVDISEFNGNKDYGLPVPATFVIDRQGTIRFAFVDTDYTKRAEPADVIRVLQRL